MCEPTKRKRYPSDLTDAQWEMIEPFVPPVSAEATVPTIERREIVNAILDVLRTGCSWRQMPHDLPNGKTAHHYFRIWTKAGIWEPIMTHLRKQVRAKVGRDPEPSAAIVDSQSIKTAPVRGQEKGFDGGKKSTDASGMSSLTRWDCFWQSRSTVRASVTVTEPSSC